MPVIPIANAQVSGGFVSQPRAQQSTAVAQGIESVGASVQKLATTIGEINDNNDIVDAQLQFMDLTAKSELEFGQDTGFGDIRERYKNEMKAHKDTVLSGLSSRAKRTLAPKLDESIISSDARFNGITQKRESEFRLAKGGERNLQLKNTFEQAPTPEDAERIMGMWETHAETLLPYMNPAVAQNFISKGKNELMYGREYYQMGETIKNTPEFQKKKYEAEGMSSDQILKLQSRYNSMKAANRSEAAAFEKSNKANHDVILMETGKDDGYTSAINALDPARGAAQAREDKYNLVVYNAVNTAKSSTASGSIKDSFAAAKSSLAINVGTADAAKKAKLLGKLDTLENKAINDFKADPYLSVMKDIGDMPNVPLEEQIDIAIDLQKTKGNGIKGLEIALMPTAQKAKLSVDYSNAETESKIQIIDQVRQSFGKYSTAVLAEMDVNGGAIFGAEAANNTKSQPLSGAWIAISETKTADIPIDPATKSTVDLDFKNNWGDTELAQTFLGLSSLYPADKKMNKIHSEAAETVKKMALTFGDYDKAAAAASDVFGAVADEDIGYVYFSSSHDADDVEDGLERAKSTDGIMAAFPREGTNLNENQYSDAIEKIVDDCLWVPDGDDSVVLVNKSGQPYEFDGSQLKLTIEEASMFKIDQARKVSRLIGQSPRG